VHDEVQGLVSEENIKIVVQGVPINAGVPIEIIGGILGAAVFVIAVVTIYFKRIAASHQSTKKEALAKLATMRRENLELHNNLKMMKQYNDDELGMIEAQITTFRKDFNKKKTSHDGDTKNLSVGKDIEKLLILAKELESEFVIGKGSFGEVHKSKYRGTHVAVKTLHEIDRESLERFQAEILLMADLHHTNVIQLVGACWEKDLMALVMEFAEKGMSTEVLVEEGVTFTWDDPLLKWCMDTSRAMRYLHGVTYIDVKNDKLVSGVIHRDLKPDNCLVTDTYTIKVADFGEARAFNENNTMTQVGTPLYIAPEVVKGDHYSTQADVFSFAMTVLAWSVKGAEKLLTFLDRHLMADRSKRLKGGTVGSQNPSIGKVSHNIITKGWRPKRNVLKEVGMPDCISDLLTLCWLDDPEKRPSFSEIMDYLETEAMKLILPNAGYDTIRAHGAHLNSPDTGRTRRSSVSGALKNRIAQQKIVAANQNDKSDSENNDKVGSARSALVSAIELLKGEGAVESEFVDKTKVVVEGCIITDFGEEKGYLEGVGGDELVSKISADEAKEEGMLKVLGLVIDRLNERKAKRTEFGGGAL
jgi:serine/threonine protein kinase